MKLVISPMEHFPLLQLGAHEHAHAGLRLRKWVRVPKHLIGLLGSCDLVLAHT